MMIVKDKLKLNEEMKARLLKLSVEVMAFGRFMELTDTNIKIDPDEEEIRPKKKRGEEEPVILTKS